MNKRSGFNRASPQVQSEEKRNQNSFQCELCEQSFERKSNLDIHKQSHPKYECNKCAVKFVGKKQLERHELGCHEELEQHNCNDCPFQGNNRTELRRHIQRSKICTSGSVETCYTCNKVFASYWHLMNHRKSDHPSQKSCRYFKMDACDFDANECWYIHKSKVTREEEEMPSNVHECRVCDEHFLSMSELMKHKKTKHRSNVLRCRDFLQGKCSVPESSCWYLHEKGNNDKGDVEHPSEAENQDFHKAQKNIPPDQMMLVMNLLKKLSSQVEMLEKRSMRNN